MTKLRYFNQDNRHVSAFRALSCLLVALKSQFVGDEMRMQTWKRTELLQMLGVTTIGSHSHVNRQALGEVRHLVDAFLCMAGLPRWCMCKATFNSSVS